MESRYSTRVPVECSVVFAGDALIGEGRVIDVSLPGCLMESQEDVKVGDYVRLKLSLPDQKPPITVPLAVVRWAEGNRVGVEFIRSSEDDQVRLTRFVRQYCRTGSTSGWLGGIELLSPAGD